VTHRGEISGSNPDTTIRSLPWPHKQLAYSIVPSDCWKADTGNEDAGCHLSYLLYFSFKWFYCYEYNANEIGWPYRAKTTEICRPGSEVRFQSLMRNTFPCVTVERVVLWIEYSVSDVSYNERIETALQPMLALWLQYLLQSLEIAMYPTVQVPVVRNSCVSMPALWLQYLLQSLEIAMYPTVQVTVVRNSYGSMPALWLQYLLQTSEIAMYPTVQVTVVRNSYVS